MKPYISVCAFTIYNTNLGTQLCLETDVPTRHRSFKPYLRTMGPNRSPFKSLGKSVKGCLSYDQACKKRQTKRYYYFYIIFSQD